MPAGTCNGEKHPAGVPNGVGFCGKLPTHSDFVRRRVSDTFARRWDDWLDAGLAASRLSLGADWRERYLTSPIWRFITSPGCCGDSGVVGILMPSVDRVGRHHPLTIVATLPDGTSTLSVARAARTWFQQIERLALSALVDDFRFDEFDASLASTAAPSDATLPPSNTMFYALDRTTTAESMLLALIGPIAEKAICYSLWWTVDADERLAACGGCAGLPPAEEFHGLLCGSPPAS